jgi:VanZ family protein
VRTRVGLWAPVVVYMAAIFLVSSLPTAPLPSGVSDTSGHWLAYAGLALVTGRAVAGGFHPLPPRLALVTFLIATVYGISDETHQHFVPGRVADVRDIGANAGGAATSSAALWAWDIIRRRLQRAGRPPDAL